MWIPALRGKIERRILVNYRIDPDAVADYLPSPFRPKVVAGYAIGGICLIRLGEIRPRFLPLPYGLTSENAAHRFAVEWEDEAGKCCEGVFIPRRDTNSRFNSLVGGRLFPGVHHYARFEVLETLLRFEIAFRSADGTVNVEIQSELATELPRTSIFPSIPSASAFFETGSLGYSSTVRADRFDALELRCHRWQVDALRVSHVESSFFAERFPGAEFDCALLMRDIAHEWHPRPALCFAVSS